MGMSAGQLRASMLAQAQGQAQPGPGRLVELFKAMMAARPGLAAAPAAASAAPWLQYATETAPTIPTNAPRTPGMSSAMPVPLWSYAPPGQQAEQSLYNYTPSGQSMDVAVPGLSAPLEQAQFSSSVAYPPSQANQMEAIARYIDQRLGSGINYQYGGIGG